MGFRCPVCGDPQADAGHLANHLAITAVTRGGSHEDWLDEHVPDWEELGEAGLAEEVHELADDAEYPQVFEDTTGQDLGASEGTGHGDHTGHDHGDPSTHDHGDHTGHDHGNQSGHGQQSGLDEMHGGGDHHTDGVTSIGTGGDTLDEETERVIREAMEMRRQYEESEEEASDDDASDGSETE